MSTRPQQAPFKDTYTYIILEEMLMSVFDLYSKRMKRSRGEISDVYVYDRLPSALRVQIVHILRGALGVSANENSYLIAEAYESIVDTLCREYGRFNLGGINEYSQRHRNHESELLNFILQEADVELALDAIELSFMAVDLATRRFDYRFVQNYDSIADNAIEELNLRFAEHSVGFRFAERKIIRIDSELIHAEVVKPALLLLHGPEYSGAQDEFLAAHEHYRSGNYKEALNDSLKSMESVLKSICKERGWPHKPTPTASELVDICFSKELIPVFWQSHFSSLANMLKSSVPTGRNKLGGHGQGPEVVTVPAHLAGYMLHMTAATIVFLVEANKAFT